MQLQSIIHQNLPEILNYPISFDDWHCSREFILFKLIGELEPGITDDTATLREYGLYRRLLKLKCLFSNIDYHLEDKARDPEFDHWITYTIQVKNIQRAYEISLELYRYILEFTETTLTEDSYFRVRELFWISYNLSTKLSTANHSGQDIADTIRVTINDRFMIPKEHMDYLLKDLMPWTFGELDEDALNPFLT
jgi:hypothetical protein